MKIRNLRHGYTNRTSRQGKTVLKQYHGPGAPQRWQVEAAVLNHLQDKFPVPKILNANIKGGIQTTWMYGSHAQDLLEKEENGPVVMAALGDLLKTLQAFPIDALKGEIPGSGDCLVHGDFGPQNLILQQKTQKPAAMLDWEWAHLGSPVEDLAWVEWFIRMHHQKQLKHLAIFFDHYGDLPEWEERKAAMAAQCKRHIEFARMLKNRKAIQIWSNRLVITNRFNRL